jgi:hypothetical protein
MASISSGAIPAAAKFAIIRPAVGTISVPAPVSTSMVCPGDWMTNTFTAVISGAGRRASSRIASDSASSMFCSVAGLAGMPPSLIVVTMVSPKRLR